MFINTSVPFLKTLRVKREGIDGYSRKFCYSIVVRSDESVIHATKKTNQKRSCSELSVYIRIATNTPSLLLLPTEAVERLVGSKSKNVRFILKKCIGSNIG